MKQGQTLNDLAREVARVHETKVDYVADTRKAQVVTTKPAGSSDKVAGTTVLSLEGNTDTWELSEHAHRQVADRLGIPKNYYDRLRCSQPQLLDENINQLFQREPEERMIRTLDGKVRAVLSNKYRRLDNYDLANAVLPVFNRMPGMQVHSCELTDTRMYIKVVFPSMKADLAPMRVGDVVQMGAMVSNSEVGAGKIKLLPMLYVCSCANGAIMETFGTQKAHLGRIQQGLADINNDTEGADGYQIFTDATLQADDKAFWMKVQDTAQALADEMLFAQLVGKYQESYGFRIVNPAKTVEKLADKASLSTSESEDVLKFLAEGGELSGFGLAMAITRMSQDVESYDRATELETIGGRVVQYSEADYHALGMVKVI
jgi:hypothetical protein